MIEKLRKNYGLSLWLVRLFFVVTYVFAHWYESCSSMIFISNAYDFGIDALVMSTYWMVLLSSLLSAVVSLVIVSLLTDFVLSWTRMYFLPRKEFNLVTVFFFAVRNLMLGLFNLTYYFTPVVTVWGGILYKLIASAIAAILLYVAVKKVYLNNSTSVMFFRMLMIMFVVWFGISILMTLSGGIAI